MPSATHASLIGLSNNTWSCSKETGHSLEKEKLSRVERSAGNAEVDVGEGMDITGEDDVEEDGVSSGEDELALLGAFHETCCIVVVVV